VLTPALDVTSPTVALSLSARPDAVFPYRLLLYSTAVEPGFRLTAP
jgi:hypothetical protein